MSIKVKNPETQHEYEMDDSILIYNKIPFLNKKRMLFKNMTNGELKNEDGIELAFECMEEMVIGWKNVEDDKGDQLDFKKEYIKNLPVDVVLMFFDDVILPDFHEFSTATTELAERGKEKAKKLAEEKGEEPYTVPEEEAGIGDELGNSEPM